MKTWLKILSIIAIIQAPLTSEAFFDDIEFDSEYNEKLAYDNWLEEQENKNILRYLIYRYKYNIFPIIKKVEDYPPNIQIEITSICNLRCIMCNQSDKTFSNKSKGFMGHMKFELFKKRYLHQYLNQKN